MLGLHIRDILEGLTVMLQQGQCHLCYKTGEMKFGDNKTFIPKSYH